MCNVTASPSLDHLGRRVYVESCTSTSILGGSHSVGCALKVGDAAAVRKLLGADAIGIRKMDLVNSTCIFSFNVET